MYGLYELKTIHQNTKSLYRDRVVPIVQLTSLRYAYGVEILSTIKEVENHEISFREAIKIIEEAQQEINTNWQSYKLTYLTPAEKLQVKNLQVSISQLNIEIEGVKELLNRDDASFEDFTTEKFSMSISKIVEQINDLVDLQVRIGKEIYKKSETIYTITSERFYVLITLCLVFAVSFSYYIIKNVKDIFNDLRESEKKYRNIFENMQDIFYQNSLSGDILDISPSVEKITDYNREELIGTKTVDLYYDPMDREKVIQLLKEEGELKEYELRLKSKLGEVVHGLLTNRIVFNEDGTPSHIDGVFRSINKRKHTEEKLRQSEARLKEAQAIANMGNWDIDMVNDTHTWSDEIYKIYGISKEEIEPSTQALLSFVYPEDLSIAEKEIKETFEAQKDSSSHFRFIRKDGLLRFGYIEWRFELNEDSYPIRIYGILQDITERKRTEHEREKMIADIIHRNKKFEQFSYIVSHNLRRPVANILGLTNALRNSNCETERIGLHELLVLSAEQLEEVIKALNEVLKVRNENTDSKEPIYFLELIKDVESEIPNLLSKEGFEISTDFSVDTIITIRGALKSIFYNLVSNSIKYRQQEKIPFICIKNEIQNGKIRISFKDNGMGINLEKYEGKIFGLSQRFHPNIEGRGIGLFMVKAQVELLGGAISIKSELEVGTEFIIELPMN